MNQVQVSLDSKATIVKASEIHKQLMEAREESSSIQIDAEQVTQIDTSILQLFCSFKRLLDEEHGQLSWLNPSDILVQAADVLGVTDLIGLTNKN